MTIRTMLDELMNLRFCLPDDEFDAKYKQFIAILDYQLTNARTVRKTLDDIMIEGL